MEDKMKQLSLYLILVSLMCLVVNTRSQAQPGAFSLVSPTNGAWASARPYFDWGTSSGAVRYQLYIDGVLRKDSIATSYYQFPSSDSLTEALHTWYVVADDGLGNTTQSTQTWSILVDATPPNTFDLVSPTDMQWTNALRPTFQWSASNDAGSGLAKYQLWIDGNLRIDNISSSATSIMLNYDLNNGNHTWQIKAVDAVGNVRGSNEVRTLRIDDLPPRGEENYATGFDGTNDTVRIQHSSILNYTGEVTLEAWVKITSYSSQNPQVIHKVPYYALGQDRYGSGYIQFQTALDHSNPTPYTSNSIIPLNIWTHIAATWNGSIVNFYMNGVFDGSRSVSHSNPSMNNPVYIGKRWPGQIDEVRVWNKIRSGSDILNNMRKTLSGNETGIVGYWRFNEGSGSVTYDRTQNGNNGTLLNGAYFTSANIPSTTLGTIALKLLNHLQYVPTPTPTFIWDSANDDGIGVQKYQLFIDGILYTDNITDTLYTITNPISYGQHTWFVKVFDLLDNNQPSPIRIFHIDTSPPNPFSLVSPTDSQVVNLPTPNFTWQSASDSTGGSGLSKYQLWIDGVVNIDSVPTGTTTTSPNSPLSESPHTWFVKAYDKVGNVRTSAQTRTVFVDFNPPTQFDLISPANNETVYVSKPVFIWQSSSDIGSGLVRYELHISGQSTLNLSPTDTSVQLAYSLPNGTYTWFVNAVDRAGRIRNSNQTDWKVVINVQPPEAPSMQYPSDDTVNLPITLILRWNASVGAEMYRLQLSTDSLFGSFLVNDSTLTDTLRQVGPLSNKMKYYWRVNAKNTGGISSWSEVWKFTTIVTKPSTPNLVSPTNGAIDQPITLTLKWNTSVDASLYRLQVATNPTFTTIVYDDSTLTDTLQQVEPLLNSTLYYWHVNAKNVGGTSAYSTYRSFTTIVAAPTTPVLASPLNGTTNQPTTLTVNWNASTGATSYRLQVSTDSSFGSTVVDDSSLSGTSRQIGPLSNDTKYYWHVRAKNVGGISEWSTKWYFTTIELPSQVLLLSPPNDTTFSTDSVNCDWQEGTPSITAYWYERASDSLFTINQVIDSSLIVSSYITYNLVNGQTYWWRVKAKNVAGWGPFSEKRKFNVDLSVSVNDEKGLPKKFSLEQNYPNPFNPSCVIQYALPERSQVILKIYNLLGQEVAALVNEDQPAGYYYKQFDANGLPSGIYIYRIVTSSGFSEMRKMLLLR